MKHKNLIINFLIPIIPFFLSQILSYSNQTELHIIPKASIMIPVNYILWLCLYNLCFTFFSKTYKSIFLYLTIATSFTLINYYKIKLLYQVFVFTDLSQIKNLLAFFPNFVNQSEVITILVLIFSILGLFLFILKKYCHKNNSKTTRLILFPLSIFILLIPFIFTNQYYSFFIENEIVLNRTNSIENCKLNGVLFCFFDDLKNFRKNTPTDYSKLSIQNIYSNINDQNNFTQNTTKPNIIIILSEALFDVTKLPNINFSQDPIKNIRPDIKATMISPQLSGGTANVEFEILTGLSNYFLDSKVPYSQSIRQNIPSLFTIFKENGYHTTIIHPYLRAMYNRTVVYNYFGLDKFISIEDMKNYQKAGPYISDKSFMDEVIKQYQSIDQPQLIFGLTMQNHYPFEPNRFTNHQINFTDNLPEYEHQVLQSYIDGIHLSNISYKFLKETILQSSKPTIVIYFGDHLPLLITKGNIFNLLGYFTREPDKWNDEDNNKMYSTPISLYTNFPTELNVPQKISPNFLSLEILKLAKITPKYQFKYLQSLTNTDTILNKYFTPKFTPKQINDYSLIQYDVLNDYQYLKQF